MPPQTGEPSIALAEPERVTPSAPFESILFDRPRSEAEIDERGALPFFVDLNLDQLFTAIAEERGGYKPKPKEVRPTFVRPGDEVEPPDPYNLRPFFCVPLEDIDAIAYRHEVMLDLEGTALRDQIRSFAQSMRTMREHLARARKLYYHYQKASWFVDAVEIYCDAVSRLADELPHLGLKSRGFLALSDYLADYVRSDAFQSLIAEAKQVKDELATVTYSLLIKANRFTVTKYDGEPDYSVEVEETFQKFRQGAVQDYRLKFSESVEMDHIEAIALDFVAKLYPNIFGRLREFCDRHRDYLDPTIRRFDREVQFYLAYLEFMQPLKAAGLKFSYPRVSGSKEVRADETFDLALANKLIHEGATVVCNDFSLKGRERIFVVSGPNNGGKTTFARTFGQLHYLASLGYPVPGRDTQLFLYDRLFTHFEKEEHIENLRGKLQDELIRIHEVLQQATSNSVIVMNESFASTTLEDALFLGREVIQQLIERDVLALYVTFIDELSSLGEATVSMVSTVVPENPAQRTFHVVRKPADGLAYAAAIADKYGLGYGSVKRRIAR